MSILNRPSDGLLNIILVLAKCVLAEGPIARDRLLKLCAPSPAVGSDDACRKSLNTALDISLFHPGENGIVLAPDLPADARNPKTGIGRLRDTICTLVLSERNNLQVWATEDSRAADFTRAASWVLAQDPFRFHGISIDDLAELHNRQLPEKEYKAIANESVRWPGFRSWAVYLGFGWDTYKLGFMPDPSVAIRAAIPTVFHATVELDQSSFLHGLAWQIPVLDGGRYRSEVEGKIERAAWHPPPEGQLSASLSLALLRLEREGVIRLDYKDDPRFGHRTLTGRGGRPLRRFSHVRLLEAA
jgi:hypothetical protein